MLPCLRVLFGACVTICPLAFAAAEKSGDDFMQLHEIQLHSQGLEQGLQDSREQRLQDTPLGATVFSATELRRRQIRRIQDLLPWVPNFSTLAGAGYSLGGRIIARGIGQSNSQVTLDPAVGIYLDGIRLERELSEPIDLYAIERVEILRGAQGELYGDNTIGGIISLISRNPTQRKELSVEPTIGNHGALELRLAANYPLSKRTAANLTLVSGRRNDLTRIQDTGNKVGAREFLSGRLSLRRQLSSGLVMGLTVDLAKNESDPLAANLPSAADGDLYRVGRDQETPPCAEDDRGFACFDDHSGDVSNSGFNLKVTGVEGLHRISVLAGYRRADSSHRLILDRDSWGVRKVEAAYYDGRIRLASNYSGHVNWQAEIAHRQEDAELEYNFVETIRSYRIENDSYSVSTRITYDPFRWLFVQLGIRHGWESKELSRARVTPDRTSSRSRDTEYTSYRAAVQSRLLTQASGVLSDLSLYLSQAKGYKSPSWSPECPASGASPCFEIVDEERAVTREFGIRSAWLDSRVNLNLTVFSTDYKRPQVDSFVDGEPTLTNLHLATIRGVELEFDAALADTLLVYGHLGYQDSAYDRLSETAADYQGVADRLAPGSQCLASDRNCLEGLALVGAPEHSAALGVRYDQNIGTFTLGVDASASYSGDTYMQFSNAPHSKREALLLTNLRLRFAPAIGPWELVLWGRNLTDEQYPAASFGDDLPDADPQSVVYPGEPRILGISFSYSFGSR